MADFYRIIKRKQKDGTIVIEADFYTTNTKDLMIAGKAFKAVYLESESRWSASHFDVIEMVDEDIRKEAESYPSDVSVSPQYMRYSSSTSWTKWISFIKNSIDHFEPLDCKIKFANSVITRDDYCTKHVPYSLVKGDCPAYDRIMSTLYDETNRQILEWAVGCVLSGDSVRLQKFIVLYGEPGSGKSTFLNILQELVKGYWVPCDIKAMGTGRNAFALEQFRSNPLVAIQHDGDLSTISDNTILNSLVSHETMTVNVKHHSTYSQQFITMLFLGTNRPVNITEAKSGLMRRMLVVTPTGKLLSSDEYEDLMEKVKFELGAIAFHCRDVYKKLGFNYYKKYRPLDMMGRTNSFYDFMESHYIEYSEAEYVQLKDIWSEYKNYAEDKRVFRPLSYQDVKTELDSYFKEFHKRKRVNGQHLQKVYTGFIKDRFDFEEPSITPAEGNELFYEFRPLSLESTNSLLDLELADCPAQYATDDGKPSFKWDNVNTILSQIDTSKVHYVRVPENLIVIDFDLKDADGNKSMELNLREAAKFPTTYAEFSKSGGGVHLHYYYDGDVTKLSRVYSDNVEVKVYGGKSSLRRKLSFCNEMPIAHLSSGLPLKEVKKKLIDDKTVLNEAGLRTVISKCLKKEYDTMPGTKVNIDFIYKVLQDAYESGKPYDVSIYKEKIFNFASKSTHHPVYCTTMVGRMKFKSKDEDEPVYIPLSENHSDPDEDLIFFDVEVFPNLFIVVWKPAGKDCVIWINPTVKQLLSMRHMKLVGFNCKKYDNHIIYYAMQGASPAELYELSQRIIVHKDKDAFFRNAYDLSYTDVLDFASSINKKSLKKFEIELKMNGEDIHHEECSYHWDEPVPEEAWDEVASYCVNDVIATEKTFYHLKGDWAARKILAEVTGMNVNTSTNSLTTKLVFGDNKNPQSEFIYPDLSELFPGYRYFYNTSEEYGKKNMNKFISVYRGIVVGEGGLVVSNPGMYGRTPVLDVASMHPSSIIAMNLFGDRYTKRFAELVQARLAVKHRDFETMKVILDGKLEKYITAGDEILNALTSALKTAINSVYGLTAAKFPNAFRDPRNVDNVVAKRGALFMVDLMYAVQERGGKVVHIKTDSIKIENASQELLDFAVDFGKQYGYTFEVEEIYDRICLVNKSTYIAKEVTAEEYIAAGCKPTKHAGQWVATGDQFKQPYVFKSLFSHEPIKFYDMCETKTVQSSMYLDFNEDLPEDEHCYQFVGRAGLFTPVKVGYGGAELLRKSEESYSAVTGTKGYRWIESEVLEKLQNKDERIDRSYYISLVDQAVEDISQYGSFDEFVA